MASPRPEYKWPEYLALKAFLAANWVTCPECNWRRATSPDHRPPLSAFPWGRWEGELVGVCRRCNSKLGGRQSPRRGPGR